MAMILVGDLVPFVQILLESHCCHCRPATCVDFMVVLASPMIEESRDVLWNEIVFLTVGLTPFIINDPKFCGIHVALGESGCDVLALRNRVLTKIVSGVERMPVTRWP